MPGSVQPPATGKPLSRPQFSQSLERGLAILRLFTATRPAWGVNDMADAMGWSRSTTHRYATTLVELGYLYQDSERKYRLAAMAQDVGQAAIAALKLRRPAWPLLQGLRRDTGWTARLDVLDEDETVCALRVPSRRLKTLELERPLGPGVRRPFFCTASGKVLVANQPDELRQRLVAEAKLRPAPPDCRAPASKAELDKQLEAVRQEGLGCEDAESAPGWLAVALPVQLAGGTVPAAISLEAHSSIISMERLVAEVESPLAIAAGRLAGALEPPAVEAAG
jgi:IclR family pca regulon transcriptional regulator